MGGSAVCVDLQAVRTLEFFGELYSLAKGFGPFLRGFGQRKGWLSTSTSPSLRAYAELHALSPLRGSISPWATNCWCSSAICREFLEPELASFRLSRCTEESLIQTISCIFQLGWGGGGGGGRGATINIEKLLQTPFCWIYLTAGCGSK